MSVEANNIPTPNINECIDVYIGGFMRNISKKVISFLLSTIFAINIFSLPAFAANSITNSNSDVYKDNNVVVWGLEKDNFNYAFTYTISSNTVVLSKIDKSAESLRVYEKTIELQDTPVIGKNFYNEIEKIAVSEPDGWKNVNITLSIPQTSARITTTDQITTQVRRNYYNSAADYRRLVGTNSSMYPGYMFRIYEMFDVDTTSAESLAYQQGVAVGTIASTILSFLPVDPSGGLTLGAIVGLLLGMDGLFNAISNLTTKSGTLYFYYTIAVTTRYTTVNNSSVTYSEASKKDTYWTFYDVGDQTLSDSTLDYTMYDPYQSAFTSSNYQWLITQAYNNYT